MVLEPEEKVKGSVVKIEFKNPEIIEVRITLGSSMVVLIPISVEVKV